MSDDCPEVYGTSVQDFLGCLDTDGDGWSDQSDEYPNDASRHLASEENEDSTPILLVAALGLLILTLAMIGLMRRKNVQDSDINQFIAPPIGPPLPPEGLPAGWTIEQWMFYGEDYLKRQ